MITPSTLRDVIATLEVDPYLCITFPARQYRRNGYITIHREGRDWLLHRYLAHVLGIELADVTFPTCATFGCMNPRHRSVDRPPQRRSRCPNGHEYTRTNTIPGNGHRKCKQCREERNARRRVSGRKSGFCKNGHKLTDENVYRWTDAQGRLHKRCRICTLRRMKRYRSPALDT